MKLKASLIGVTASGGGVMAATYAKKLASQLQPGQKVQMVDGRWLQVLQKMASPEGMHFVVQARGGQPQPLTLRQFAALGPVSPAMRRLASFIRRAIDLTLDNYVKQAIRAAGYPVDETMDWGKYLDRVYVPLMMAISQDQETIHEIIRDMVVDELYDKQVLSPDSAWAHFTPDHAAYGAGKPLEKRVSAYLVNLFKNRKDDVMKALKRHIGVGAKGSVGLAPAERIDGVDTEEEESRSKDNGTLEVSEPNHGIDEVDDIAEIRSFFGGFREWVNQLQRIQSNTTLNFITDCFEEGMEWGDIRDKVMGNAEFSGRFGKPLDLDGWNFVKAQWTRLLRRFAQEPGHGWSNTPIARLILHTTEGMKEKGKKPALVSSLRLADAQEQVEQLQQVLNNPAAGAPPPPAAPLPPGAQPNTNVPRPVAPATRSLNMAPPAPATPPATATQPTTFQPQQPPQQAARPTIPPEIPGVNHTAAASTGTFVAPPAGGPLPHVPSIPDKFYSDNGIPDPRKRIPLSEQFFSTPPCSPRRASMKKTQSPKFATLRRIAEQEPQEVGLALHQLAAAFSGFSSQLGEFSKRMNLASCPVTASVREKVAHRNLFARELKRMAAEDPAMFETAFNDFYARLNTVVGDFENLADNLGVTLNAPQDGVEEAGMGEEVPPVAEPTINPPEAAAEEPLPAAV